MQRAYAYRLHRRPDPFLEGLSFAWPYPEWDLAAMNRAADHLRGIPELTPPRLDGDNVDFSLVGRLAASEVKRAIYGNRLVLFAPLYITNKCQNECRYCAFRASNKSLTRRNLTRDEIARETQIIIDEGHKRILLVAGDNYPAGKGLDYVYEAIETIYGVHSRNGEIRRLNVNVAALDVDHYRRLKQCHTFGGPPAHIQKLAVAVQIPAQPIHRHM